MRTKRYAALLLPVAVFCLYLMDLRTDSRYGSSLLGVDLSGGVSLHQLGFWLFLHLLVYAGCGYRMEQAEGQLEVTLPRYGSVRSWRRRLRRDWLADMILDTAGFSLILLLRGIDLRTAGRAVLLLFFFFLASTQLLAVLRCLGMNTVSAASLLLLANGLGVLAGGSWLPCFWGMEACCALAGLDMRRVILTELVWCVLAEKAIEGLGRTALSGKSSFRKRQKRTDHVSCHSREQEKLIMKNEIILEQVSKQFRGQQVIAPLSLTMTGGRIYGFVGRNGSGKTVLLKMICGLLHPDTGSITVSGHTLGKDGDFPRNMGVIIETPGFLNGCTGFQNLLYLAQIRRKIGRQEICAAMELLGLDPHSRKKTGAYSLGMRQRLGIAQAIMEKPDQILLDEPMNSLDEDGLQLVRRLLLEEREKGTLIVLASHSKEDIGRLCDEVYEFRNGEVKKREP